jgi:chromosome segregation ATPase
MFYSRWTFQCFCVCRGGYLVKYIDKNGYEEEAKRHDLAMEKLTEDREKYTERITDRKNKLAELRKELVEANSDIKSTNQSLELLRKIQELTKKPEPRQPQLSDYYTPSPVM